MESGYTGTVVQKQALQIGSSGFVLTDGVFNSYNSTYAEYNIVVNGDFTMEGGVFDTPDNFVVTGSFSVTGGIFDTEIDGAYLASGTLQDTVFYYYRRKFHARYTSRYNESGP
jgi:hypothetical protein